MYNRLIIKFSEANHCWKALYPAPTSKRWLSAASQRHANLPRQRGPELWSQMASNPHRLALPRHFNQRAIAALGLHPNPLTVKLRPLKAPSSFQLNYQPRTLQYDFFAVSGMPRIDRKCNPKSQQLCPRKRHDQYCALKPEKRCNAH